MSEASAKEQLPYQFRTTSEDCGENSSEELTNKAENSSQLLNTDQSVPEKLARKSEAVATDASFENDFQRQFLSNDLPPLLDSPILHVPIPRRTIECHVSDESQSKSEGDSEEAPASKEEKHFNEKVNKCDLSQQLNIDFTALADCPHSSADSNKEGTVGKLERRDETDVNNREEDLMPNQRINTALKEAGKACELNLIEEVVVNKERYKPLLKYQNNESKMNSTENKVKNVTVISKLTSNTKDKETNSVTRSIKIDESSTNNKHADKTVDKNQNFNKQNLLTASLIPLRKCESIPNIIENGITENESNVSFDKLNAIYRLSLRLSQYLPLNIEIPNADNHRQYDKAGYLQKLSGRGFPYLNQWKRKYCVLTKGRLFLYEKDTSKGSEKHSNVVDLKYFDHVAEAGQKETKKVSNIFVVTSQDRSFFDPGRHLFAADTLTEMHDWINKLRESIELIRNNNRPSVKIQAKDVKGQLKEGSNQKHQQQQTEQAQTRSRSEQPGDNVDSKIPTTDEKGEEFASSSEQIPERDSEKIKIGSDKGETGEGSKDESNRATQTTGSVRRVSSSKKIVLQTPSFNIESKPQLGSITKYRIKGPAGRRAPQARRTIQMKKRASSLTALQHDYQLDNVTRSGSAQGFRTSTLTADELSLAENTSTNLDINSSLSKSSENNLDHSNLNVTFDDIEGALFFEQPSLSREKTQDIKLEEPVKKRKASLSFSNLIVSRSNSDKCRRERTTSVFRNATFKFSKFHSSTSATAEHPDSVNRFRRCTIL